MATVPEPRAPKPGDHLFLVDGSSYIFRAYHALPPLNRKSDGLQINAVLGFCNMLWKLMRDLDPQERPTHLAVIFDKSEQTFRNEFYPAYKAHRPEAPSDLIPQFAYIREAVRAFDLPCLEQAGYEADDLIATYTRMAGSVGARTTIVSSDKDLMQLVSDRVLMYDTMKDRKIGRAEVMEKFGVPPEKVIEVQALIGDSTDNVPGVPGIGPKTAAQLIGEYGDLETLLARAGEIKQEKRRQSLVENAKLALLSKQLVTLDSNVALEVPLADLAVQAGDHRKLVAFLKAMEFTTLVRRVAEATGLDAAEIEPDEAFQPGSTPARRPSEPSPPAGEKAERRITASGEAQKADRAPAAAADAMTPQALAATRAEAARARKVDRAAYKTLRTLGELEAWLARATDRGALAIACQTSSLDPLQATLCGFALAVASGEACYVPLAHREAGEATGAGLFAGGPVADQISEDAALATLRPVLEDASVLKVGHNVKFEWAVFAQRGIEMAPLDDTMLMSYALDAGRADHDTAALARRYLGHTTIDVNALTGSGKSKLTFDCVAIDKAAEFAAEDADVTLRVWRALKPRLTAEHMTTVYETLERPLAAVLARMERRGIAVDRQVLSRLSGEFAQRELALVDEIQKLAGEPINPGSPKQIADILFGKLQLPGGTKTKTGQWSTGARTLEELAEQGHALPQRILDWRQVSKLKSTYTDALPGFVNPTTHRVHTSYALAATPTGRLSSSEPNLQNIPIRTEEGRKIRRAFIATPGHKLVSADYSQIELRL